MDNQQPVEPVPLRISSTRSNKETSHILWGYTKHSFLDLNKLPLKAEEELYVHHPEFREHIEKKYTCDAIKENADLLKKEAPEHIWSDHGVTVDLNIRP